MIDPAASLYTDIDIVERALEPFGAPHVNEYAGLRWMQRALEQRRANILNKIAAVEQSSVTVRLRTATGSPAPRAQTVAALLGAVQEQLRAGGHDIAWPQDLPERRREESLLLEVDTTTRDDERWSMVLQRPAGPLRAQPLTEDGERLAFDAALDEVLDRLVGGDSGELGAIVTDEGLSVELISSPATGGQRTVLLDRHTAPAARPAGDRDAPDDG